MKMVYCIAAAKNLELLGERLSENNFDFSYCYWMILLGAVLCPFLWLGSPKDMKYVQLDVHSLCSILYFSGSCARYRHV